MTPIASRILVVAAVVAGIWFFRVVAMPLALGLFLALSLAPVAASVRRRVPEGLHFLGILAATLVLLGTIAALVGLVWLSFAFVDVEVGEYREEIARQLAAVETWLSERGLDGDAVDLDGMAGDVSLREMATGGLSSIAGVLTLLVLTLIFFVFMVGDAPRWRRRLQMIDRGRIGVAGLSEKLGERLRRYLAVMTLTAFISGASMALLLWLLDVPFALALGLLTFLMSYLPTIGSIIAVVPVVLIASVDGGLAHGLVVLGAAGALEQITGNWMAPKLQGKALQISPLAVLASLVFWGFLWGVVGALLAVPILIALVTAAEKVPELRAFAILAGGRDAATADHDAPGGPPRKMNQAAAHRQSVAHR